MSRLVPFYNCLVKFLFVNAWIAFNLINKDWKQYESGYVSMHAYICVVRVLAVYCSNTRLCGP